MDVVKRTSDQAKRGRDMLAVPNLTTASYRAVQVRRAIRLVTISVFFGLASGAVSVTSGLLDHSLSVFAVGLGVLADVTGSASLIWRFRAELREPALSASRERLSAAVVALALAVVAAVLAGESITALAQGSRPASSAVTMAAACASLVVLAPLAVAKRRLGDRMNSRALQGDGTLSGVGAASGFLALAALIAFRLLGWWWADRVAAMVAAAVAAAEAWRTVRQRSGR
jgi:divalent metal cation (Fe/Co/Zn/Cd) transporter